VGKVFSQQQQLAFFDGAYTVADKVGAFAFDTIQQFYLGVMGLGIIPCNLISFHHERVLERWNDFEEVWFLGKLHCYPLIVIR